MEREAIIIFKSVEDLTFNGITLSEKFDEGDEGYFIVNEVKGRGVMSASILSSEVPNSPGSFFRGKEFDEREIEIDFTIKGTDFTDLRRKVEEMNRIFHEKSDEVPFSFADEPERTYYGAVEEVDYTDEKSGIYQGTITIICSDPFKYGDESQAVKLKELTWSKYSGESWKEVDDDGD